MTNYTVPPRRDLISRVVREVDDFASWLLYGSETWLVALLKGVPRFLFMYFVLGYIPNYAATVLAIIPFMLFNLAGGSLIPLRFPLLALGLGAMAAGGGATGIVYLWFEYRRVSRREAEAAAAAGAAWTAGG